MHLELVHYENLKHAGTGKVDFRAGDSLRKWTVLPSTPENREVMACLALTTASKRIEPYLNVALPPLLDHPQKPLKLEFVCIRHSRIDDPRIVSSRVASRRGMMAGKGIWTLGVNALPPYARALDVARVRDTSGVVGWLTLAYGADPAGRADGDDFDFHDRSHAFRRLSSFFSQSACLTVAAKPA